MTQDATPRDKPTTPEASDGSPADEVADRDAAEAGAGAEADAEADAGAEAGADAGADADAAAAGGDDRSALTVRGAARDQADDDLAGPAAGGDASAAPPAAAPPAYTPSYAFLFIVSVVSLAADLGTKWWATVRLTSPERADEHYADLSRRIVVIKDHLNLIFAKNMGGAWGILQDESEAVRRPFFLLISVAAVVFIVSLYRKLEPRQWALRWGLPLVLGGALGNLVDRIRYGYVVDFVQIRFSSTFVWPTFNVADIAIVVGVGLMAIDMFTSRRPAGSEAAEDAGAARGPSAGNSGKSGKAPASGG